MPSLHRYSQIRRRRSCAPGADHSSDISANIQTLEGRALLSNAPIIVDTPYDLVDANDGLTSLREAVAQANANADLDVIKFDPSLKFGTIMIDITESEGDYGNELVQGELVFSTAVIVDASETGLLSIGRKYKTQQPGAGGAPPGWIRVADPLDHRVLRVTAGADVELSNVIIRRGQVGGFGYDPGSYGGAYGAGIYNEGNLTLRNSFVGDNRQQEAYVQTGQTTRKYYHGGGGGIYNADSGTLELVRTTVGVVSIDAETLNELGQDPGTFGDVVSTNYGQGHGGGIMNEGTLILSDNSVVHDNQGDSSGGGIFNAGTLQVTDSSITSNVVTGTYLTDVGVESDKGGGIANSRHIIETYDFTTNSGASSNLQMREVTRTVDATITTSTIADNEAPYGGAIHNDYGHVKLDQSTLENNLAKGTFLNPARGGGIMNEGGLVEVEASLLVGNRADTSQNGSRNSSDAGGAIHNTTGVHQSNVVAGQVNLQNTTVSGNDALQGAGIFNDQNAGSIHNRLEVRNSTITANITAQRGGGIRNLDELIVESSIIAGNSASIVGPDIHDAAWFRSEGFVLTGINAGYSIDETISGGINYHGVDPLLTPLGDYGGPTRIHGLEPGSPAVNAAYSSSAGQPDEAQRGEDRIIGPKADVGAFELIPPASMRIDNLSDVVNGDFSEGDFTLREAVLWAAVVPGADTIALAPRLVDSIEASGEPATISLESTLVIDSDVTIYGPGADQLIISGQGQFRVIEVTAAGRLKAARLAIRDGWTSPTRSSVNDGAGIRNYGDLVLDEVELSGHQSGNNGGAVHNSGSFIVTSSAIVNNDAGRHGGGVFSTSVSVLDVTNSTLSGNQANDYGGAVYNHGGSLTLLQSTVVNNSAENAGGIRQFEGTLEIGNSIVAGNTNSNQYPDIQDSESTITTDRGNNFIGDGTGGSLIHGANGNQVGTASNLLDPLLGTLSLAGGVIPVHAILPTSSVIDAGNTVVSTRLDQRGIARDGSPDIGAFEYVAPNLPNPIVVDLVSGPTDGWYAEGEITLREAILFANDNSSHDEIVYAPELSNLVRGDDVVADARTSWPGYTPARAVDGDLNTAWFAANGDAANLGSEPFLEFEFSATQTIAQVNLFGVRGSAAYHVLTGRVDFYCARGSILQSEYVEMSGSNSDAVLKIEPLEGVHRIRFTSLTDKSNSPGLAEIQVFGPTSTTTLDGNALEITSDLKITGPGADRLKLDAESSSQVFIVRPSVEAMIENLTISGGHAGSGDTGGGGILNEGTLTLDSVFVTQNTATGVSGGGIHNIGSLTLLNSSLANNDTDQSGGGLFNSGPLEITNSTIALNDAANAGGIYNAWNQTSPAEQDATVSQTTIARNSADSSAGGIYDAGKLQLTNTMVAENTAGAATPDGFGSQTISNGHNLIGSNQGWTFTTQGTDIFGTQASPVNPLLSDFLPIRSGMPLYGILPGSPAIDAGTSANAVNRDQRGHIRPEGNGFDIGAFETVDYQWQGELIVDNLSDILNADYTPGDLTLREALLLTNARNGSDTITFVDQIVTEALAAATSSATIHLTKGTLVVADDVTISPFSPGLDIDRSRSDVIVVDAGQQSRLFDVETGVTASIRNLTLTNGQASNGGAVDNDGDLTLTHVELRNNSVTNLGGAIYNTGDLTIRTSTLDSNSARRGGAIYSVDFLELQATTLSNNHADEIGGGILGSQEILISTSTLHDNSADGQGGAIAYSWNSEPRILDIKSSTISGNSAAEGAGVYLSSGARAEIRNSTLHLNNASSRGGGFYHLDGTRLSIGNSIIAGNTASTSGPDGRSITTSDFTSLSPNLFSDLSGTRNTGIDLVAADPKLGPLEDNGGPTFTHLLKPGSPAIDQGNPGSIPLMDQRGRPMVNIPLQDGEQESGFFVDIGAYETQGLSFTEWEYRADDKSQFGPGEAAVLGFGFAEADPNGSINPDPLFLGFEFDTGPLSFGEILTGPFGSLFGGELDLDFSGRLGFEVGFYLNSGSVDVAYDGSVNYVIEQLDDSATVSAFREVEDGSLYTVSPRIGFYVDLVLQLDADIDAVACVVGCVEADNLLNLNLSVKEELLSVNRQMIDDSGRPVFSVNPGEGSGDVEDGDVVARDDAGQYFDINGNPVSGVGAVTPLFDGEMRIYDPIVQLLKKAKDLASKISEANEVRKLAKNYNKATKDLEEADQEIEQLNDELDKANKKKRNARTDEEWHEADAKIKEIEGEEGKTGKLKDAENAQAKAKKDLKKAEDAITKKARDKQKEKEEEELKKQPKVGLFTDFGEAEGSLLGLQADLKYGVQASGAEASLTVGTMQATIPDISLSDRDIASDGTLSATTKDFVPGSEVDNKRQAANLQVDIGGLLGAYFQMPIGKLGLSAGPIDVGVTTVSYELGPQLNVRQDVSAQPSGEQLKYTFHPEGNTAASKQVYAKINGQWVDENGNARGTAKAITSLEFNEGSRVEIVRIDQNDTEYITVVPTLTMDSQFSNDIGLDIDLKGQFEAFEVSLAAFGEEIFGVGPLLSHEHTLGSFALPSFLKRKFDLEQQELSLTPFTLFEQNSDGITAATAYAASLNGDTGTINAGNVASGQRVFMTSDMRSPDETQYFQTLRVQSSLPGQVQVLDESLTVTQVNATTYDITGFSEDGLRKMGSAVFAIDFSAGGTATVTTSRSMPAEFSVLPDVDSENQGGITSADFETILASGVLSNDIDGNGKTSPLSDGVLIMRYLSGKRGFDLTRGAIAAGATRTSPAEIEEYIDSVIQRAVTIREATETRVYDTLDFDGNGVSGGSTDGRIFARYLAGYRGTALVDGLTDSESDRSTPAEILQYIESGRSGAVRTSGMDEVIDRSGRDVLGIDGAADADSDAKDGSSASSPTQPDSGEGDAFRDGPPVYEFTLSTFADVTEFEEVYLNDFNLANRLSRVAAGTPVDFGSETYKELVHGLGNNDLLKRTVADDPAPSNPSLTAQLGIEEPLFVEAPDAAGYEYDVTQGGYLFTTIAIDPHVGGNLLVPTAYDLYVFENNQWKFAELLETVGNTGFITHTFAQPVQKFRLYSLPLGNGLLHNESNAEVPQLSTTTGFILSGGSGTPKVAMTELAPRHAYSTPDPFEVVQPAHANDAQPATTTFSAVRAGADVHLLVNQQSQTPVQMVSATKLEFSGHDNAADTLTLDGSGGPFRVPLEFFGGFREDAIIIQGGGVELDLLDRDEISEVELIDIRGGASAVNTLRLDADTIADSNPFSRSLLVKRDADDVVEYGSGWQMVGTVEIDSHTYDHYAQGNVSLYLTQLNGDSFFGGGDYILPAKDSVDSGAAEQPTGSESSNASERYLSAAVATSSSLWDDKEDAVTPRPAPSDLVTPATSTQVTNDEPVETDQPRWSSRVDPHDAGSSGSVDLTFLEYETLANDLQVL